MIKFHWKLLAGFVCLIVGIVGVPFAISAFAARFDVYVVGDAMWFMFAGAFLLDYRNLVS